MALVSFKDWSGPNKNPYTRGDSPVVVEQRVDRVEVHVFGVTKIKDIERLVEVVKANREVSPAITTMASLRVRSGLGFDQYYARIKAEARIGSVGDQIVGMVEDILASRQPVATL